jgi:hypothetical protein
MPPSCWLSIPLRAAAITAEIPARFRLVFDKFIRDSLKRNSVDKVVGRVSRRDSVEAFQNIFCQPCRFSFVLEFELVSPEPPLFSVLRTSKMSRSGLDLLKQKPHHGW